MMNIGKGYLTYVLAALAIIGGAAGWALGFVDDKTALGMIYGGASLFGIRRAIG